MGESLKRVAEQSLRIRPIEKDERPFRTKEATVVAVSADGGYRVALDDEPDVPMACAPFCTAGAGDRVLVAIKANGKCDAVGRLGGDNLSIMAAAMSGRANDMKAYSLIGGADIPGNADLNAYTEIGNYKCDSNAKASTLSNKPDLLNMAFTMQVFDSTGSGVGYLGQRLTRWDDGEVWYRAFNNYEQSWGAWKCTSGIDSIVAEGTSGIWRYRKWASGVAECWGFETPGEVSLTSNKVGGVYTNDTWANKEMALPFTFTAVQASSVECYTSGYTHCQSIANVANNATFNSIAVRVWGPYAQSPYLKVSYYVLGRWK